MAAQKRTLDGKQRLEPLVAKLKGRGLLLRHFTQNATLICLGFLVSAFGLLLASTGTLMLVAPETAQSVSVCRGDPTSNLMVGGVTLCLGLTLLFVYRQLPQSLLVVDKGIVLQYRSGSERCIAWHEIDCCYEWTIALRILRLNSGRLVVIPSGTWPAWHDFTLLLTFNKWLGKLINPNAPLMSEALKLYKLQIIGPGIEVPALYGLQHRKLQRSIHISTWALPSAFVFSFIGWINAMGVLFGLAPLLFGVLIVAVLQESSKPADRIVLRRKSMLVQSDHLDDVQVIYVDTKWWGISPMEITISFLDKRAVQAVAIDANNAVMLIEVARIAEQLQPIRPVEVISNVKISTHL
jgi:hypothetical protein